MIERDGESVAGKRPRLVIIEWQDSVSWSRPWHHATTLAKELREHGPDIIRTIGWLVDETKDYVLTVADLDFDMKEGAGIASVGRAQTIPRGCIIRMRTVRDPYGISPKRKR